MRIHRVIKKALVFFWCSLLLNFGAEAASDPTRPLPLGRLIDVGGYRVHLYCTGSGSPTVMIVGGGFSFDWGLVQPKVAEFTRVCTYDPSGTAWSNPFRAVKTNGYAEPLRQIPKCSERVEEIHKLLRSASIDGPYVLVGFSIGGLFARLYAHSYPKEVTGMVLVDHAFIDPGGEIQPDAANMSHSRDQSTDFESSLSEGQLVSCPDEFVSGNTAPGIGISPAKRFS